MISLVQAYYNKNKAMKVLCSCLLLFICNPIFLYSQVIGDRITIDSLRKIENFFTKENEADFIIRCQQRQGTDKDGYLGQVWFLYLPKKSNHIIYLLFEKDTDNFFLLTKSSQLDKSSGDFVFSFIEKFSGIERKKCWHYAKDVNMPHLNVNAYEFDVKYSKNEWILDLVKRDEVNSYVYSTAFKHRVFNKCIGLFKNFKQRKRFNRFSESVICNF